jgi:uncharacterized protein (DUF305 family)
MNKNTLFIIIALIVGFLAGAVTIGQMKSEHEDMSMNMSDNMMHHDSKDKNMPMTSKQMMDNMSNNLLGKTGDEFDAAFLEEMIPHHLGAVQMAQLVLKTSKRPELIKLATDIIAAQEKEISTMRGWQKSWFGIQAQ